MGMKIVIVTDQFPPTHFGGMAQHAWHISHYLAKHHDLLVLLPEDHMDHQEDLPFEVVPQLTMKYPRLDALRILKIANKFKPDVVHVCTAALAFPSLAKRYPVVTRVVGNDFLRPWCVGALLLRSLWFRLPGAETRAFFQNRETALRKKKVNKQLRRSARVVANSEWTKKRLMEEGVAEKKIETIVGGMDASLFVPAVDQDKVRQALGLSPQATILVTAANLIGKKGFDTVIRAVERLKDRYPRLEYIAVGDGGEEVALKALADQLNVRERIHFVGRRSQSELCNYYQSADIYVQVSRNHRIESGFVDVETMGRTYFEAGGCGTPVIASNVGGVPSVVEHGKNGLLVDNPENVSEVVEKITELLDDPGLRERMGAEGIRLAKEKFSWESVGTQFEKLLIENFELWPNQ